jgi:hypothetical protein
MSPDNVAVDDSDREGPSVSTGALESYLAGIDPVGAPTVLALDHAIRAAEPHLDVAIKYRILTYALRGDWRTWVCAVQVTKNGVCLRFLYGVLLDDPRGVLRAGTSVLKTWDMAFDDVVDAAAVGAYVSEAVARYDQYRASTQEVLDASRAAARARRAPRAPN